jgi:hypothetical protein
LVASEHSQPVVVPRSGQTRLLFGWLVGYDQSWLPADPSAMLAIILGANFVLLGVWKAVFACQFIANSAQVRLMFERVYGPVET